MKGVVFTEFLEMVEEAHGIEFVDVLTSLSELHSGGAYTSVGNYPHEDMLAMVGKLSEMIDVPPKDLVTTFGKYLFKAFSKNYSVFFEGITSSIQLLEGIEAVIHTEVRKLYPEASLPTFDCFSDDRGLVMDYSSDKPFADLAEGLIQACISHFADDYQIHREEGPTGDAHSSRFVISKVSTP